MPRKAKLEKQTITVIVNGKPIGIILHPPTKARKSWYAYWNGLASSVSTGQPKLEDAIVAAENMVKNGGKRATIKDAVLSDEEFEAIQRAHFSRHQDPMAQQRAAKTLDECLDAISAFRDISNVKPVVTATPDDCAAFQRKALTLPKNWRHKYPKSREEVETLSANTIVKWSRTLQAAFDRANRNAGRKCVRGIVDDKKLLSDNPWKRFTWIAEVEKPIRQFTGNELLSLLDFLAKRWPEVTVASALAKFCLWSSARRAEVTALQWSSLRQGGGTERHFEIVGKWGVEKWVRIPERLYQELLQLRTDSPFVFAAYNSQLRQHHEAKSNMLRARMVGAEFKPMNFADWFHEQIADWARSVDASHATMHVFRKTSLQYAVTGESLSGRVARDARVSEGVLMTHYAKLADKERREQSNRTFERIVASLEPEVAKRFGYDEEMANDLEKRLDAARAAKDWKRMAELLAELEKRQRARIAQ